MSGKELTQEQQDERNYLRSQATEPLAGNYEEAVKALARMRDSNLFDPRKCAVAITQTEIAYLCAKDAADSSK